MHLRLFRQEVLEARAYQWAGAIVLRRPVPMQVAAIVSSLLVAATIGFLIAGHYTRSVTVNGRLMPSDGALKIIAPQFGVVLTRRVKEGDLVEKGQVLYEISSERNVKAGAVEQRIGAALLERRRLAEEEREVLQRQLQSKRDDLGVRQRLVETELAAIEQEQKLQGKRITIAEGTVQRFRALRDQGFVSEIQLAQVEGEQVEQQLRMRASMRSALSMTRELQQLKADASQLDYQIVMMRVQAHKEINALDKDTAELQGRGGAHILAPESGTVTALTADQGEAVSAGAALATILPARSDIEAHLQVPSNAIGFVSPGQKVRIRISAFPHQKFGHLVGTVFRVDRGPTSEEAANRKPESIYRVGVKLDRQFIGAYGEQRPLKPGMVLDAEIRQEKRRLIEWLFDPIRSVARDSIIL